MQFSEMDLDMLREIGNVGASNAATALSTMIGKPVSVGVPSCKVIPFTELAHVYPDPEEIVLGSLVQLSGDIDGFILMLQSLLEAARTVYMLTGQRPKQALNVAEYEPMREICNILTGSYISAISSMTGLCITPCVPEMTLDMSIAILNIPALVYGEMGDDVLMLDTGFGGEAHKLSGRFFLMPTMESYDKLTEALLRRYV